MNYNFNYFACWLIGLISMLFSVLISENMNEPFKSFTTLIVYSVGMIIVINIMRIDDKEE